MSGTVVLARVTGNTGAVAELAPVLFVAANLIVGVIGMNTIWLAIRGRLLPRHVPVAG